MKKSTTYCHGDYSDVPDYVWQAYADYPDDYPVIPAVETFKVSAFTGRWYVVATSIPTASVAFPCDCPVIDVGLEPPIRYRWQVGQRPDPDLNAVVINPLLAYYEYYEGQPNVFKDPEIGNINIEFVPNPLYTCYVVKVGPIVNGTYAYYVLAIEHMPWDIAPPPESGFTFPNKGTMSFEVYAQDVEEFYELYADDVEAYVAEQSGDIPEVINNLKLQHLNHTGCIYPHEPSYLDEKTETCSGK